MKQRTGKFPVAS